MDTIVDDPEIQIAAQIRQERERRNWSLAELAERSGVAKASISKIERNEMSPSAGILGRLAAAFDLTLASLLLRAEGDKGRLVRAKEQPVWRDPATGYVRRQIFRREGHPLELARIEFPPGKSVSFPPWSYEGFQHVLWVISGTLTLREGGQTHVLEAGDSLAFGPPSEITFSNKSAKPCTYLVALVKA